MIGKVFMCKPEKNRIGRKEGR